MVYWPRIQPHSNETQSLLSPTSTNPRGHGEKMCIPRINFRRRVFLPRRWSLPLFFGCAVLGACAAAAVALRAQDKNPFAGDAKAAKLGESQFRANCAFCHGLGARGGGRGPDLSRAQKHTEIPTPTCFERLTKAFPARPCRRMGRRSKAWA